MFHRTFQQREPNDWKVSLGSFQIVFDPRCKMYSIQKIRAYFLIFTFCIQVSLQVEEISTPTKEIGRFSFGLQNKDGVGFLSHISRAEGRKVSSWSPENLLNETTERRQQISLGRSYDHKQFYENNPSKQMIRLENLWFKSPTDNYTRRNESVRKIDHSSLTWPAWSTSKKEVYNNRNRKNHKHTDPFEDFLGLESKLHELSDRKYIHEHEGFFFPIHVPTGHHHEKEDHILIPILLIILIPLLLFAIIIPLNANLLSTLFLIMQNNGATTTAAQLATGRRKRRSLYTNHHPVVEEKVFEMLEVIDKILEITKTDEFS
ncbi:hypothetical protein AVEN_147823-1 [Araneus ventricosus]|uniref:Uncharacterized protein n=1 Tax=Araneus ventricosus TaxID=182803 RepID=A0A4Y2CRX2_ARAVE|nr:hypothetical protein AVEN_147823-1 [Araneus ventricosus]